VIRQGAGTHYDPEIVDIFIEYENEINDIYNKAGTSDPETVTLELQE